MTYYILTIKRLKNDLTTPEMLNAAYEHVRNVLGHHMTEIHFCGMPKKVHELDKWNRLHHHSLFMWTDRFSFSYRSCKIPGYRIHFKKVIDPIASFPRIKKYLTKQVINKYEQKEIYFDNISNRTNLFI